MSSYRDKIRDSKARAAYLVVRRLKVSCAYVAKPGTDSVTLFCWAYGVDKSEAEILGMDSSKDVRVFEIPKQEGFDEETALVNAMITFEGHKFHVKHVENEDGVGAIFKLTAQCTKPNIVGAS